MARATNALASTLHIGRNVQRVLLNKWGSWVHAPEVLCESIQRGVGTEGSSANFLVPKAIWTDFWDEYAGAEVLVYASESSSATLNAAPWFHGWLTTEPRRRSATENHYGASAVSAIRILDKIPCGMEGWTFRDWNGTRITERNVSTVCPKYPRLSSMHDGERIVVWHPRDVLFDLFNVGLPSFWKAAIGLGLTDALREQPYKTKGLVEWDFTGVSMLEALETLVSSWGDITFNERFGGMGSPRVYLDFYKLSDTQTGRKIISVPSGLCDSGAITVEEISMTTELADRVDRIILTGAPYKNMITVWTGDPDEARRLRKAWTTKLVTIVQTSYDETSKQVTSKSVTKTNEEWVLDDPDYGRRGSDLFNADCEFVFMRYKLPRCLLVPGMTIDPENAVRVLQSDPAEDQPKRIERQVFKTRLAYSTRKTDYEMSEQLKAAGQLTSSYGYDCAYEYGYGYGYQSNNGFKLLNLSKVDLVGEIVNDDVPGGQKHPLELISGAEIYDDGTVMLSEPAVNVIYKGYCGSTEQVIRAEADVAVSVTVSREINLMVDTGQPPYQPGRLSLVGRDGMVMSQKKDDWEYAQLTSLGQGPRLESGQSVTFPFFDPSTGQEVVFDWCVYQQTYDPDADNPQLSAQENNEQTILVHVTSQQVVKNDYPIMRELARRLLVLKSRPKRTFEIVLPVLTQGYTPGDIVSFEGLPDGSIEGFTLTSVEYNFSPTEPSWTTRLSLDNSLPESSIRMEA